MDDDFLLELQYSGLLSRIKRLSDNLLYSTKEFYKIVGVDIDPNWHLIFLLLSKHKSLCLTDISDHLKVSHPGIIKIVNNMKRKGYIQTHTDNLDSRKQIITLTEKAYEALPELQDYWLAFSKTIEELLEGSPEFMSILTNMEDQIRKSSYKDRTLQNLNLLAKHRSPLGKHVIEYKKIMTELNNNRSVSHITINNLDSFDLNEKQIAFIRHYVPENTLIVYGTLAPGKPNHSRIEYLKGEWKQGVVHGGKLESKGWGAELGFNGFVPTDLDQQIDIPAYILFSDQLADHWHTLDQFEGDGYRRILACYQLQDGNSGIGYIYAINDAAPK